MMTVCCDTQTVASEISRISISGFMIVLAGSGRASLVPGPSRIRLPLVVQQLIVLLTFNSGQVTD